MPNKELPQDLSKAYEPQKYEDDIYKLEESSGFFNPDAPDAGMPSVAAQKERFSIVLPPPNVTGTLHMGHATMLAIEDIMTRFNRMQGRKTLWVPGTDHAAIATQNVVEKKIYKGQWPGIKAKTTRHDLGREKFLELVDQFVQESKDIIHKQLRKMGASMDWSREAYTMDPQRERVVKTVFKMMYEDGLIYRGKRVVNWCPRCASTLANDEVEYKTERAPFYYFKYGPVVIGTARPETKFLDKVIVVHPSDKRYKKLVGKKFDVEWIDGRVKARVIADIAADPKFGTGAMTITPAHDIKDFEIAQKHGIEIVEIIGEDGKLTKAAGDLAGMPAREARSIIVERLKKKGLVEKIEENYEHNLSVCYRCGYPVEPLPKEQWFIAVEKPFKFKQSAMNPLKGIKDGQKVTLKKLMQHVVKTGQVNIIPDRFKKTYFHWIDNLRDWCISRQIWFGVRVPVWYCVGCGEPRVKPLIKSNWFFTGHGQTDWNKGRRLQGHTDIPLNDTGRAQARDVAEKLKAHNIDLVISSDLKRAKETGAIIARVLNIEHITDKGLREGGMGIYEGRTKDELTEEETEKLWWDYAHKPKDGESLQELEDRAHAAIVRHKKNHNHKNVVIVSHSATIFTILRKLKNIGLENLKSQKYPGNMELIQLNVSDPCAKCGSDFVEQDPDTLDTWFSSGLWTFSTLGWPAPRIWFVRHAEAISNAHQYLESKGDSKNTLTAQGKKEAEEAGRQIARHAKKIDLIFTSPLPRAMETAKTIAKHAKSKIIVDERLREIGLGKMEGCTIKEWSESHKGKNYAEWGDAARKLGVEPYSSTKARARAFMDEICSKHADKNIVVVSHQATLAPLIGYGKEQSGTGLTAAQEEKMYGRAKKGEVVPNDLARFHPTTVLETGYDILFFWVARMIMMTTYALGEVPFKNVYLHGLVRDKEGDKMSKTKPETAIDPLEVAQKYGTDAVRLSLVIGTSAGNDFKLWDEKIAGFRNFTNKLWNIARFMMMNGARVAGSSGGGSGVKQSAPESDADKWIMFEIARTHKAVTEALKKYEFSRAGDTLRDFTWGQLADWYLEAIKPEIKSGAHKKQILSFLFETILKMWHPFMPFVTEVLWKEAGGRGEILSVQWPEPMNVQKDWAAAHKKFEREKERIVKERQKKTHTNLKKQSVTEARNLRAYIKNLEAMLKNKDFLKNAPAAVIQEKKLKLAKAKEELGGIEKAY